MPLWDGEVSSIPELLKERRNMAKDSWESKAPSRLWAEFGRKRPQINQFAKQLKAEGQAIVVSEDVAQSVFEEAVLAEYEKRSAQVGSPVIAEWDRDRKLTDLDKLFSGSGIEGLPE